MAWDDEKQVGDELTAPEWNSMVDDQKPKLGAYFDAYASSSQAFGDGNTITVNTDTIEFNTDFSLSSGEITFNTDGIYLIIARVSSDWNDTTNRATSEAWIEIDGVEVAGSKGLMYNRTDPESDNSTTIQLLQNISSGETLRVRASGRNMVDYNRVKTVPDGCRTTIIRIA